MNEAEALALFHRFDHPTHGEYPPGFDYPASVQRARKFVSELDSARGTHHLFETEAHIQDASFHSQADLGRAMLRFSNFGEMLATTSDEAVPDDVLQLVHHLAERFGYRFVPSRYTDIAYSGRNPGVDGIRTWGHRFFEYL